MCGPFLRLRFTADVCCAMHDDPVACIVLENVSCMMQCECIHIKCTDMHKDTIKPTHTSTCLRASSCPVHSLRQPLEGMIDA